MLADLALKQAGDDLIGATLWRGLLTVYRDANCSGDDVRLYFATGDNWGYNNRDLMLVGLYDNFDMAMTIASIGYGISETAWEPLEGGRGGKFAAPYLKPLKSTSLMKIKKTKGKSKI